MSSPTITLDRTYADLYKSDEDDFSVPLFIPYYPNSELDFTTAFPRSTKYSFQSEVHLTDESPLDAIRHSAIDFLAVTAQRHMFVAGSMPVAVFDVFEPSEQDQRPGIKDAIDTLSMLSEAQRPLFKFIKGPADTEALKKVFSEDPKTKLAMLTPMDGLDEYPHIVDPRLHYELLSKRGLAFSGLQTPKSHVLDLDDLYDPAITDPSETLQNQLDTATTFITTHPLPFALKFQQTMSGLGTFLIHDPPQRQIALSKILPLLRRILQTAYRPLRPASLVIQPLVHGCAAHPACLSANFYVPRTGPSITLGISTIQTNPIDGCGWLGCTISYPAQEALRAELAPTILQASTFLQRNGYRGPAGVDVIIDPQGTQWVVDLNPRSCGDVALGFLQGHFWHRRGLAEANLYYSVRFPYLRQEFWNRFEQELREGRIVVISWFDDKEERVGWAGLILGAEDAMGLRVLEKRVREEGGFMD